MKNTDLTNTYRELDSELAILHDQLESHRSFENILFLPTPEKIRSVREKWNDLKTQVENLNTPDNVYRLVKHHLNDFLDSLKFTIEEKEHNPEAPLLDFVYYLQEIARCDRRSNEVRLDVLTRKLQAFHENQDLILNLIHTQYGENEASLSSAFALARLDMQRDQKLLNEYFPDFTEEQIASLSQSFRIFIDQLQEMADLLGSDCQSDSEELLKDDLSKTIKMDPEAYRSLLKNRLGVSLDELLAWHKEEIEKQEAYLDSIWSDIVYFPVPDTIWDEEKKVTFGDTWMQSRTYGGDRGHEGCDIMADINERGNYPVISVCDGTIEQMGWLELGGYRIGIRSPHGAYFYYAHLSDYAEGFSIGDEVHAGELIAFMGDTGYSKTEGTAGNFDVHLHFGIYLNDENKREFSVNSYSILQYLYQEKKILHYQY